LMASSIAAMFSGKSRTEIVCVSLLGVNVAPLNPLPSGTSALYISCGLRYLISNILPLKSLVSTYCGSGRLLWPEFCCWAKQSVVKTSASASAATALNILINIIASYLVFGVVAGSVSDFGANQIMRIFGSAVWISIRNIFRFELGAVDAESGSAD